MVFLKHVMPFASLQQIFLSHEALKQEEPLSTTSYLDCISWRFFPKLSFIWGSMWSDCESISAFEERKTITLQGLMYTQVWKCPLWLVSRKWDGQSSWKWNWRETKTKRETGTGTEIGRETEREREKPKGSEEKGKQEGPEWNSLADSSGKFLNLKLRNELSPILLSSCLSVSVSVSVSFFLPNSHSHSV